MINRMHYTFDDILGTESQNIRPPNNLKPIGIKYINEIGRIWNRVNIEAISANNSWYKLNIESTTVAVLCHWDRVDSVAFRAHLQWVSNGANGFVNAEVDYSELVVLDNLSQVGYNHRISRLFVWRWWWCCCCWGIVDFAVGCGYFGRFDEMESDSC